MPRTSLSSIRGTFHGSDEIRSLNHKCRRLMFCRHSFPFRSKSLNGLCVHSKSHQHGVHESRYQHSPRLFKRKRLNVDSVKPSATLRNDEFSNHLFSDPLNVSNSSPKSSKSSNSTSSYALPPTLVTDPNQHIHIKGLKGKHFADNHCYVCDISFDPINPNNLEKHINGTKHIKNMLAHYSGNYEEHCIYCRSSGNKHVHISSTTHSSFIKALIHEAQSTPNEFILSLKECQQRVASDHHSIPKKEIKKLVAVQSMSATKLRKGISDHFTSPSPSSIDHQLNLLEKLHHRSSALTEKDHVSILFVLSALVRCHDSERLGHGLTRICKLFSDDPETLEPSNWKMNHKLFEQMMDTILLSTNLSQLVMDFDTLCTQKSPRSALDDILGIDAEKRFLEPFAILFVLFKDKSKWKEHSFESEGAHQYFMRWTELIFVDMFYGLRDVMRCQQYNFDLEYQRLIENAMVYSPSYSSSNSLSSLSTPDPLQRRTLCAFREVTRRCSTGQGPVTSITMESSLEEMINAQSTGSFVFLFPENLGTNVIDHKKVHIGYVYKSNTNSQTITLRIATRSEEIESAANHRWHLLSMGASGVSFQSQWEALQKVTNDQNEEIASSLKRALFGDVDLETDEVVTPDVITKELVDTELVSQLNVSQRMAVESALNHDITLVQGPPGTGKTHVAAAIVEQYLIHFKRTRLGRPKLLLSAFSNIAVDVLTQRVSKINGLYPLRIGHESTLNADEYSLLCKFHPMDWKKRIADAEIICGTSIGSANELMNNVPFDLILVDETTQSTEPALLVALSKLKENGKLVLIGDHKQLSPTVCSMYAQQKGLNYSVFERMIVERQIAPNFLDTQYRMHPKLAEFPSMYFYDEKLLSGIGAEDRPIPNGFEWPMDGFPIAFVQTADDVKESEAVKSIENRGEAEIVGRIVKGLVDGDTRNSVTVISPYAAQKKLIENELNAVLKYGDRRKVKVRTVDGFQGSECDIIVFSATRSNMDSKVGFLKDYRRINVMLTRPKRGLIVVGDRRTLESGDEMWAQWIHYVCDANKATVNEY